MPPGAVRGGVADHRAEQADPGREPRSARPHERGDHAGDDDRERGPNCGQSALLAAIPRAVVPTMISGTAAGITP